MVEMADLQTSEGLDPKEPIPPSDDEEIYLSASDDEIPSSEESDEYEDQEDVPQNGAKPEQAEMPQIAPTYRAVRDAAKDCAKGMYQDHLAVVD